MTKEEFNWFWKDTTKEGVLNQFYYEHIQLREEIEKINKAIEYIEETPICSILEVHCGYEEEYTDPLLKILRGE